MLTPASFLQTGFVGSVSSCGALFLGFGALYSSSGNYLSSRIPDFEFRIYNQFELTLRKKKSCRRF